MAASCGSCHLRLCALVNSSLLPFLVRTTHSRSRFPWARLHRLLSFAFSSSSSSQEAGKRSGLTKEAEKELLLSLSLVSSEIQKWGEEFSSKSELGHMVNPNSGRASSLSFKQPLEDGHNCLTNFVSVLVAFLTFDSLFIQHVAGNILVVAATSISTFGSKSIDYFYVLWLSVEAAMSSICSCMPVSSEVGSDIPTVGLKQQFICNKEDLLHVTKYYDFDIRRFIATVKSRLFNVTWLTITNLFQVLHKILKKLRNEHNDLEQAYMHLAVFSLLRIPWLFLDSFHVREEIARGISSCKDVLLDEKNSSSDSKGVLLVAILRFTCSLIAQDGPESDVDGILEDVASYSEFTNLISKLISCFRSSEKHLSQYFRHKALVILIRLSSHIQWQHSYAVLWIELLKKYFEDLLYKSIVEHDTENEDFLEGSPFLASIAVGENDGLYSRHLQRQAIFILFKSILTVLCSHEKSDQRCACAIEVSFPCELQLCSDNCCHLGLLEFSEWLKRCALWGDFVDYESHSRSCCSFALSFLQLFMEEDDMLFEMLLQLLDDKFIALQMKKHRSFEEMSRNIIFHVSSIFDPIQLFHLFLYLLRYDHSVLLDYLISKDTGVLCLHYILRCLRLICSSWHLFVGYTLCESEVHQLCNKRRKIIWDKMSCDNHPMERKETRKNENKVFYYSNRSCPVKNATYCLVSLKRSVEVLHQKNLFPYNPKPLLRSFTKFQELCKQE